MHYKEIGQNLQMADGMVEVSEMFQQKYNVEPIVTIPEGYELFNRTALENGMSPLKDPKGYMVCDDNIYDYVKDRYYELYEQKIEEIESGFQIGTVKSMEGVINKIDKQAMKDIKEWLPEGMRYNELRFLRVNDEEANAIDNYIRARIVITQQHSVSRRITQDAREMALQRLATAGEQMRDTFARHFDYQMDALDNLNQQGMVQ